MSEMDAITEFEDIIDSRDVIARIEYLSAFEETDESDRETAEDGAEEESEAPEPLTDEEREELAALRALAEQGEMYAEDWHHGEALIRESYFQTYAEELADDIGAIDRDARWPLNHIDWEAAADELRTDYNEIEFNGVTYYVR